MANTTAAAIAKRTSFIDDLTEIIFLRPWLELLLES